MLAKVCCTDLKSRQRLFVEVMHTGLNEGEVSVPEELLSHANSCPLCSREFGFWVEKSVTGRIISEARETLRLANAGVPDVSSRVVGRKVFYFRGLHRSPPTGVLVTTDLEGNILAADEGSYDEFLGLT